MGNLNNLLAQRLKKETPSSKMAIMAKQSANGDLTSFSGIFSVSDLSLHEKGFLENLLKEYALNDKDVATDLTTLITLTSEVKAINNQAAILHGERIKKAQNVLKHYRDGAFTTWLIAAYGNRQTPYNFLQYYEFCEAIPKKLRIQLDTMPRQAVYTLASREGPIEKKREIIENYNGETKAELLFTIREAFPLNDFDKRRQNKGEQAIQALSKIVSTLENPQISLTKFQKNTLKTLVESLSEIISKK